MDMDVVVEQNLSKSVCLDMEGCFGVGLCVYVGCKMLLCRYELRRRENVKDKHKKMQ